MRPPRTRSTRFILVILAVVVAVIPALAAYRIPTVQGISPAGVSAGSSSFTLTVTGRNFNAADKVTWNGVRLSTTLLGGTQALAQVPATKVATAGTVNVGMWDSRTGSYSNTLTFTIGIAQPASPITISLSPSSASLMTGGSQQFAATVANTSNTAVTWSATGGTISASGLYTAGSTSGTYAVTTTSQADPTKSATVPVTITVTSPPSSSGLVAAYSFNEGSGTTVNDLSGNGNNGTISSANWSTAGKFGGALSFNGTNSWVTVNDSASLDLSAGMTLEAWMNPVVLGNRRTGMLKEQSGGLIYALYADTSSTYPGGYVHIGSDVGVLGATPVPLNSWTHLATTYDGTTMRMFVNGVQVNSTAPGGNLPTSTGPLRIGGNSVWGEYFSGSIDEVRVYNRPLSASEIQTDMNTPLGGTTPPPPSVAVAVSPTTVSLQAGGTQQFTATVSGTSNTSVNWSATGGTISSTGLYTAPSTSSTYTVTATSAADSSKTGSATVSVAAPALATVSVSITPSNTSVTTSGTVQFTATVSGTTNTAVTWSVASGGGTISTSGLYTAPSTAGTATVTATSVAAPTSSALAYVTVNPPVTTLLSASPTSISFSSVVVGSSASQAVTLSNTGNSSVTVSSATTTGSGFSVSGVTFPFTLAAAASQTATLTFAPSSSGTASGSVSFASNATNSPATVTLSGSGTAPLQHSVTLSWQPSTSTVSGYNVYRGGTSGGPYTRLNSVWDPTATFADTSVQSGLIYYYVVTSVDTTGLESGYSNQVTAIIPTP